MPTEEQLMKMKEHSKKRWILELDVEHDAQNSYPLPPENQRALMSQLIHALSHLKYFLCIIVFNNVGGASISIKLLPGMYLSYQQACN